MDYINGLPAVRGGADRHDTDASREGDLTITLGPLSSLRNKDSVLQFQNPDFQFRVLRRASAGTPSGSPSTPAGPGSLLGGPLHQGGEGGIGTTSSPLLTIRKGPGAKRAVAAKLSPLREGVPLGVRTPVDLGAISPESPEEELGSRMPAASHGTAAVLMSTGNANGSPIVLQAATPDRLRRASDDYGQSPIKLRLGQPTQPRRLSALGGPVITARCDDDGVSISALPASVSTVPGTVRATTERPVAAPTSCQAENVVPRKGQLQPMPARRRSHVPAVLSPKSLNTVSGEVVVMPTPGTTAEPSEGAISKGASLPTREVGPGRKLEALPVTPCVPTPDPRAFRFSETDLKDTSASHGTCGLSTGAVLPTPGPAVMVPVGPSHMQPLQPLHRGPPVVAVEVVDQPTLASTPAQILSPASQYQAHVAAMLDAADPALRAIVLGDSASTGPGADAGANTGAGPLSADGGSRRASAPLYGASSSLAPRSVPIAKPSPGAVASPFGKSRKVGGGAQVTSGLRTRLASKGTHVGPLAVVSSGVLRVQGASTPVTNPSTIRARAGVSVPSSATGAGAGRFNFLDNAPPSSTSVNGGPPPLLAVVDEDSSGSGGTRQATRGPAGLLAIKSLGAVATQPASTLQAMSRRLRGTRKSDGSVVGLGPSAGTSTKARDDGMLGLRAVGAAVAIALRPFRSHTPAVAASSAASTLPSARTEESSMLLPSHTTLEDPVPLAAPGESRPPQASADLSGARDSSQQRAGALKSQQRRNSCEGYIGGSSRRLTGATTPGPCAGVAVGTAQRAGSEASHRNVSTDFATSPGAQLLSPASAFNAHVQALLRDADPSLQAVVLGTPLAPCTVYEAVEEVAAQGHQAAFPASASSLSTGAALRLAFMHDPDDDGYSEPECTIPCLECMDSGDNAVHYAAFCGHLPCLEVLLERADLIFVVTDSMGRTPLFYAASEGRTDCCALLVDVRPEWIDLGDVNGDTPMHVAVVRGYDGVVRLLLESGAAVDVPNTFGRDTALHAAACYGRMECVDLLLQYGADTFKKDKAGYQPADLARINKFVDVEQLFQPH